MRQKDSKRGSFAKKYVFKNYAGLFFSNSEASIYLPPHELKCNNMVWFQSHTGDEFYEHFIYKTESEESVLKS